MKTINIMIAASEEMHDEKLKFTFLIEHLNKVLKPRGIELIRIKWDSDTDGSIDAYKAKLRDCEMCLTLYWRELAANSEQELNTAYKELKDGKNPRNLYVFFKEPTEDITEALKDFKANFVTNYGHFFCKFENVDTMNLHFILQFEAYQNRLHDQQNKLIIVKDGKVKVGDKDFVNLDNVPFASLNSEYKRLQNELFVLGKELAALSVQLVSNPEDKTILSQLTSVGAKRKAVEDEFEKYQTRLYDIALAFTKQSRELLSERMILAWELFEKGNCAEADFLFNLEEIIREEEKDKKLANELRYKREMRIEELSLAASFAMSNTKRKISDRLLRACKEYDYAITIANDIHYDEVKIGKLFFEYANLLSDYNRMHDAVNYYLSALENYRKAAQKIPDVYLYDISMILNNLGNLHSKLNHFNKAEEFFQEALEIYRKLAEKDSNGYLPDVAMTLNNLANLQSSIGHFVEGEKNGREALEIRKCLAKKDADTYLPKVALTLNCLGNLKCESGCIVEAEDCYQEALRIFRQMAKVYPDIYMPDVAMTLNNLANFQKMVGHYSDAEKGYREALEIRQQLANENPYVYLPKVATTINNLAVLLYEGKRFGDAEKEFREALNLRRSLANENPEAYLPDLAMTLNNLANLQSDLEHFAEAEVSYREALEIYQHLANEYPDIYLPEVAMILNNLATLQETLNLYGDAENNYHKALDIYQQMAKERPKKYLPKVAMTLINVANLQSNLGRYLEAEEDYHKAIEIFRMLNNENPKVYWPEFATTLYNFAILKYKQKDIKTSIQMFSSVLPIFEKLEKENSGKYKEFINNITFLLRKK